MFVYYITFIITCIQQVIFPFSWWIAAITYIHKHKHTGVKKKKKKKKKVIKTKQEKERKKTL